MHKYCPTCKENKDSNLFNKSKNRKDGLNWQCKSCSSKTSRNWYNENKGKRNKKIIEWQKANPEKIKEIQRNWAKNRRKTNLQYKIKSNLSRRMREIIKQNRSKRTLELLGCSLDEFKKYIESKFTEGMSWDKLGNETGFINIDHVIPCEIFDLSDPRQQKICFHYTNLTPIWAEDNFKKRDFLPDGRCARNLNTQEKLDYLKSLGHHLS